MIFTALPRDDRIYPLAGFVVLVALASCHSESPDMLCTVTPVRQNITQSAQGSLVSLKNYYSSES